MKVIWEIDDLKPGLNIGRSGISEQYIIGFIVRPNGANSRTMTSLVDGMTVEFETATELADCLNKGEYIPSVLL